jgi:hypothetical protein
MTQEKMMQALHDENERLGLYKDAYAEQEPVAYASIKMRVGNINVQQFITQEMLHNVDDPWRLITIYAEQCIEELKEKNT